MNFNSLKFLIFLPIVLLVLAGCPKRWRWLPLLTASYWFYMSWDASLVVLIVFTTCVSYFSAIIIENSKSMRARKLWLTVAVTASLAVLFFFKYFDFFSQTVTDMLRLLGIGTVDVTLDLLLPVGISFYTFQTLSYVIDVFRGTLTAERHFGYYALYVSYFPQLVAGPIERPENLLPQLRRGVGFSKEDFIIGMGRLLIGFFKKVVVADVLAEYVNVVYNSPKDQNGLSVAMATMLFTVQIYCDFSGYSDIALGCARIMGVRLMKNFDLPYSAESVKEFWDRWHISLSSWFKDYVYIPLGGSKKGKARTQLNVLIVFFLSGLWHGANLTFVLWGAFHGAVRVIENLLYPWRKLLTAKAEAMPVVLIVLRALRRASTFLLVTFSWLLFRANNVGDLGILLNDLFGKFSISRVDISVAMSVMGLDVRTLCVIALSIICLWLFEHNKTCLSPDEAPATLSVELSPSTVLAYANAAWIAVCAALLIASKGGSSTFIYFQF